MHARTHTHTHTCIHTKLSLRTCIYVHLQSPQPHHGVDLGEKMIKGIVVIGGQVSLESFVSCPCLCYPLDEMDLMTFSRSAIDMHTVFHTQATKPLFEKNGRYCGIRGQVNSVPNTQIQPISTYIYL